MLKYPKATFHTCTTSVHEKDTVMYIIMTLNEKTQ